MKTVDISIIIPCLNEEEYLPRLLDSIVNQQVQPCEVIVIDGNSSDKTIANAQRYANRISHLTIIKTKKQNVGYQRNIGAEKAQSEYLLFLDADVILPKVFIEQLDEKLKREHPSIATTCLLADDQHLFKHLLIFITNIGLTILPKLGKPTSGGYNMIVKKSFFHELGGFDERIVYGEDLDLVKRGFQKIHAFVVFSQPRVIYSFRRFDRIGYLKGIKDFIVGSFHNVFIGAVQNHIFEYPMGGALYKKPIRKK